MTAAVCGEFPQVADVPGWEVWLDGVLFLRTEVFGDVARCVRQAEQRHATVDVRYVGPERREVAR